MKTFIFFQVKSSTHQVPMGIGYLVSTHGYWVWVWVPLLDGYGYGYSKIFSCTPLIRTLKNVEKLKIRIFWLFLKIHSY